MTFWYFTFQSSNDVSHAIQAFDGGFDIAEAHKIATQAMGTPCIVTFWKEITFEESERMADFMNSQVMLANTANEAAH